MMRLFLPASLQSDMHTQGRHTRCAGVNASTNFQSPGCVHCLGWYTRLNLQITFTESVTGTTETEDSIACL